MKMLLRRKKRNVNGRKKKIQSNKHGKGFSLVALFMFGKCTSVPKVYSSQNVNERVWSGSTLVTDKTAFVDSHAQSMYAKYLICMFMQNKNLILINTQFFLYFKTNCVRGRRGSEVRKLFSWWCKRRIDGKQRKNHKYVCSFIPY